MSLRRRWWMAGALLCMSAAGMQRARSEELPILPAVSAERPVGVAPASDQGAKHPDPAGSDGADSRPRVSADARLARLRGEAEAAYRARNFGEAEALFGQLLALDPADAQAWLRLGNLHQQAGRDIQAMQAYRSAARVVPDGDAAALVRAKALLNIAHVGVRTASLAIDEFDALRSSLLVQERAAAARQVGAARRRASRAAARLESLPPAASGAESAPAPARTDCDPMSASPSDFHPYTVDRWIATPRRPGAARVPARAAVSEPITASPKSPAPVVDLIQSLPHLPPAPRRATR